MPNTEFSTFIDTLNGWSQSQPEKTAFRFLRKADQTPETLSYDALNSQWRSIASTLQTCLSAGDRVLLLYPPGLAFIPAFLACLASGVVAVPTHLPKRRGRPDHIIAMIEDANISVVLCASSIESQLQKQFKQHEALNHLHIIATDKPHSLSHFVAPSLNSQTLAFLQYTSGSTGQPKGVMISHGNIFHNMEMVKIALGNDTPPEVVSWLPLFHDMGLIGTMLHPLYTGGTMTLMSPASVLQNPLSWLKAISDYHSTLNGGPNFIYDLCCDKISDDDLSQLDLSSWTIAINGAEPISAESIKRFTEKFGRCGFRQEAMFPCYGMSEATSYVSGNEKLTATKIAYLSIAEDPSDTNDPSAIVSCGVPAPSTEIIIVDADSSALIEDNQVGEILVSSPSVAQGYWNQPELTQQTFIEKKYGQRSKRWLRTGDLGFLKDNELYVTGRKKDLIIIGGKNYYPQDIEQTVEGCDALFRRHSCAAFSVNKKGKETLVITAELNRIRGKLDVDGLALKVRQAITRHHSIMVEDIAFLAIGALAKTSSGKIRRRNNRQAFIDHNLKIIGHWQATDNTPLEQKNSPNPHSKKRADQLIDWLRDYNQERIHSTLMDERRSIPPYIVLDFGNQGLLGMQVPESEGGLGLSYQDSLRVIEQLGAIDITLASFVGVHNALGITPILNYGNDATRKKWLRSIAEGRDLAAFAITEPTAGSNPQALQTTAKRVKDGWLLNGEKSWIGTGAWSNIINVFAQTLDAEGNHQGVSGFAVPQSSHGMRMADEALTMGVRGMVQNSIELRDVFVSDEQLLGKIGSGMLIAQQSMMIGRLGIAAMSLGAMKRCGQLMLRYSSRRQINTGKLLDNGITLQRLDDLTHAISSVEYLVKTIAAIRDKQQDVAQEVYAACKIVAPEYLFQATDQLMQLLGGRGYIESNGIPQLFRDARLLRIFEGPTETLAMFLGSRVLSEKSPFYSFIENQLKAPEVSANLVKMAQRVQQQQQHKIQRQQSQYQLGRYAALALLQSVVPESEQPTRLWIQQQMADLAAQMSATMTHYDARFIGEKISQFQLSIGDLAQDLATTTHQVDPLLRRSLIPETPIQIVLNSDHHDATPVSNTDIKANQLQSWLMRWVADNTQQNQQAIDCETPLIDYGIDSVSALEFALDLEVATGHNINPALLWEYPTINALSQHLETLDVQLKNPTKKEVVNAQPVLEKQVKKDSTTDVINLDINLPPVVKNQDTKQLKYSLMFFSSDETRGVDDKYNLVLSAARFADNNDFEGVWLPERHFNDFGGLYPNPSTLAAAISTITHNIRLRAGSVVLPLHHPVRVAEEWSMVDNLSHGRVDIAFVKGWNPNDFVLAPDQYENRHETFPQAVKQVQQLWQGQAMTLDNPLGKQATVSIRPTPQQKSLPTWVTCNKHPQGFIDAGAMGANVLTALLMQTPDELAENIKNYRQARLDNGFDPDTGQVTLMMHSYIGEDLETVKAQVKAPFTEYLRSSVKLWSDSIKDLDSLSDADQQKLLDFAFEKYFRTSALFGTVESCQPLLQDLQAKGVNEIASLIDFGLSDEQVLAGLPMLTQLKDTPLVKTKSESMKNSNKTIDYSMLRNTEIKHSNTDVHLFCLPYAGGKASVFECWKEHLPAHITLHYLEIPENYTDLPVALKDLNNQIKPYINQPYAFYGHSMGGLLAFELSRYLQQSNQPMPIQLIIGAQHAPHLPFPIAELDWNDTDAGLALFKKVAPDGLAEHLNTHPNVIQRLTAPLKKSMQFQQNHQCVLEPKLCCPISVVLGNDDSLLKPQQMRAWSQLTSGSFQMHSIEGKHIFVESARKQVCQIIRDELSGNITAPVFEESLVKL